MAKIYGLQGAMTGKLANTVMAVRNGEQIARKYQPVVSNPNTPAQVESRAKLKLLSQLSAVMAPYIAIRRKGTASSRNLFTKKNYPYMTYVDQTASVVLAGVQLTDSVVGFPSISATRDSAAPGTLAVRTNWSTSNINRVVYVAFTKGPDSKLRAMSSVVATTPGSGSFWETSIEVDTEPCVVYAYGVRDNTDAARAVFGNLTVLNPETVAKVITSRVLTENDVTLTETSGVEVPAAV